jgi:hypothetical protein
MFPNVQSSNTGQSLINYDSRKLNYGEGFRFLDLKRLNQALDRRGANHNVSLAGNVLSSSQMFVELANSIGEMNTNQIWCKTSLILLLFIHYLFLDKLKETYNK